MSKSIKIITLSVSLFFFVLSSSIAVSANEKPANLADSWSVVPKSGMQDKFETALKKHLAFRSEKGDTRSWQVYTPIVGDDLNRYVIRFCCTKWNQVDAYVKWSLDNKVNDHWNKYVDKYVASYQHYYSRLDFDNSHWPDPAPDFKYFGVRDYQVKMGKGMALQNSKKMLSDYAKAMNWPYYWSWSQTIGGSEHFNLVLPFKDYADMTPPEQSFGKALAKHLGDQEKANKVFADWAANFKWTKYTIYRHRPELSMKEK